MTPRSHARALTVATLTTAAAVVLAGCSGGGDSTPSASATPAGKPVSQTCAELLPSSALSVYGQTFELDDSFTPAKGSPAAAIAKQQGRVCRFVSNDSDATAITLAVADLPEKSLTNLKDALYERGGSVPTYRVEGYFALTGDVGRADAFADPYWITAQSTLFTEPGGAQPVVDAVRTALQPSASASASATATPAG